MKRSLGTPWTLAKPGAGKVPATIPIIYDAKGNAVAHVLAGKEAGELILAAVNHFDEMREALEKMVGIPYCDVAEQIKRFGAARAALDAIDKSLRALKLFR